MHLGVVLMNMGGPTHEGALRPFQRNLFADEDIIKIGGGAIQKNLAEVLSKFRAPTVAKDYRRINGCPDGCRGSKHCSNRKKNRVSDCCSPINSMTEKQRKALQQKLQKDLPGHTVNVYTCMRYWIPFADTTMQDMLEDDITHAVLLPLYPHFSWTTTGSSFRDWKDHSQKRFGSSAPWKEYRVKNYHLNQNYLNALNSRIDEALAEMDEETRMKTHLIFSAHGTPMLEVRSGDPYTHEVRQTMEAIMDMRGRNKSYWLGFQSKVGFQKWTQPNTAELVKRHIQYGIKNFLMIPIAFVSDHIETLYELGLELPEDLEEEGYTFENLTVTNGLNDHPDYISALAGEVKKRLPESAFGHPSDNNESKIKEVQ